jgi:hypothetical protein
MKRFILFILLFCFLIPYSEAQVWKRKRYQATFGFGASQIFGDIGGFSQGKNLQGLRDFDLSQTRVDLNLNFKYRIARDFSARLSLTYASLHSSDAEGTNNDRGFISSTSLFETAIIGEYYFIKNKAERPYIFTRKRYGAIGALRKSCDFYAFTGIGGAAYSTKGNDLLINAGISPSGFSGIIPVGLGTNLLYTPVLNFGIEFGGRYSFSDGLDGYHSQYSTSNDVYYFLNFTITYKLKTSANNLPSFR